jgi:hypothetical protein
MTHFRKDLPLPPRNRKTGFLRLVPGRVVGDTEVGVNPNPIGYLLVCP